MYEYMQTKLTVCDSIAQALDGHVMEPFSLPHLLVLGKNWTREELRSGNGEI